MLRPRSGVRAFVAAWQARLGRLPPGVGLIATIVLMLLSCGFGAVRGGHLPSILATLAQTRDGLANQAGFRIASVAVSGLKHVTREEVLAAAGVGEDTALLFLDVEQARAQLKRNPRIAEATVRKLYPDRLDITLEEREAFALWQVEGRVSVIAADGTVVSAQAEPQLALLPFVVGRGAQLRARTFLGLLDRYPAVREQVRASIFIAERRWNLRLKNGIDIRLPETDVAQALARLAALDRDRKLLTRDIVAVDLRLPDRVTVRLSDEAASARAAALEARKPKRKGGDA